MDRNSAPWESEFGRLFAGRQVLVTGATGFLGWHLCEALVALEAETVAAVRSATTQNLPEGCQPVPVDLRDRDATQELVSQVRPELIYHLAGRVTAERHMGLVLPTLQDNLIGTVNLLLAAAETGCDRYVQVGSSEENAGDESARAPSSPYAASKAAATSYAWMFNRHYSVPVALVRPFAVYGSRQRVEKLIPYSILSLLRGEPPRLRSGDQVRDFVYVVDVVRGLLHAGRASEVVGETVELGTGEGRRIRDVLDVLIQLTGAQTRPKFGAVPDRASESGRVAGLQETRRLLGWEPRWSLHDGLAQTVAWYRSHVTNDPSSSDD